MPPPTTDHLRPEKDTTMQFTRSGGQTDMTDTQDGYTSVLFDSDDVTRTSVRYNRYGIEIAADLYRPRTFDETATHAAVVIGPSHGGVKEQGPGVYAQELARRGFVALGYVDPNVRPGSQGEEN